MQLFYCGVIFLGGSLRSVIMCSSMSLLLVPVTWKILLRISGVFWHSCRFYILDFVFTFSLFGQCFYLASLILPLILLL